MKIRFLLHDVYGPAGGVLRVVLSLAADLAQRHDVELISVLRTRETPVHRLPSGVSVRYLVDARSQQQHNGSRMPRVRRFLERWSSRLVIPQDPRHPQHNLYSDLQVYRYIRSVRDGVLVGMQPAFNAAIARFARPSVVRLAQEHRPFVSRSRKLRQQSARYYSHLDTFLTLTERDAKRYRKLLQDAVPVRVMPNGTPIHAGPKSTQQDKVVVAAGRLVRSKGFDRLIDAWVVVSQRHPDWILRIYGEGAQRSVLQEEITARGIDKSAHLMGYSANLQAEMARASIFALSSRAEGYPMVLLEAMACGLPVVSFDCPTGPREIVTPRENGLLVDNGDVGGMALALDELITSRVLREEMGRRAYATARSRSQEAITARWERLCEELLEQKRICGGRRHRMASRRRTPGAG